MIPLLALLWFATPAPAPLAPVYERLYNFDFPAAQRLLDEHLQKQPNDPLAHATRASALLFQELDRLGILESEFFSDDDQIAAKRKLKPDPVLRERLFGSIAAAQTTAQGRLTKDSNDKDALFAMALSHGLTTDYRAFVEKRQIASLADAKSAQSWAARLLRLDSAYEDAWMSAGISEYLLGSLPFFVKWFVKLEDTQGSKSRAIENLQRTAARGRYMGPFAKILLSLIYLREKKPAESRAHLLDLTRSYPANSLLRKELAKVTDLMERRR